MPAALLSLADQARQAALEAGFHLAGIAPADDLPELQHFPAWVERGHAGEMEYMKARDAQGGLKRASLRRTFPWARSVIVCALDYSTAAPLSADCEDPSRGWISRYAWSVEDYHDSVLRRLRQVEAKLRELAAAETATGEGARGTQDGGIQTRCYVDTGPVVERVFARHAGIGWMGKNTCVINERRGSWLFLGVILTSIELEPSLPAVDRCGSCTRCIDACPTDAIIAPGQLDSRRCISYLTIEKRGAIDESLRAQMGRHLFGCDICQDVCPWNAKAARTATPPPPERPQLVNPALEWLASLTQDDFRRLFRGSAVRRTRWSGWRRNLAVAMGNTGQGEFIPQLEQMSHDPDPVVTEHARWALEKLRSALI